MWRNNEYIIFAGRQIGVGIRICIWVGIAVCRSRIMAVRRRRRRLIHGNDLDVLKSCIRLASAARQELSVGVSGSGLGLGAWA